MATIVLYQKRVAKNGIVSFKADSRRSTGTIYADKRMFPNGAPAQITVEAEGIQVSEPVPVKASKAEANTETANA